jgi:quercetin dioxygenase-like cupin family protein
MNRRRAIVVALLMVGGGLAPHGLVAQDSATKRTDLLQHDLSTAGREVVQVRVDFAHGAAFPAHSHPGEEIAYVIEGELEYQLEGKPAQRLKAGDVVFIPAGTSHTAKNIGSGHAVELATYFVEKGKPLVALAKW